MSVIYNADARDVSDLVDEPVHLVVTSPPYWSIKNYKVDGQIGFGQSYEEYIDDTLSVLRDCGNLLVPGGRMCVNIGEQYLSTKEHSRYRVAPIPQDIAASLHGECQDNASNIDYMGSIIWNKVPNQNASGGGKWMGTTYWPTDIALTFEHEYILVFRKWGARKKPSDERMEASRLTKKERADWSRAMWRIDPERDSDHPAAFPLTIPYRLIKMFSFVGDTVLDPFLGGGTTLQAAIDLERECIGIELSREFAEMAQRRCRGTLWGEDVQII